MTTEVEPILLEHIPLDQNDEGLVCSSRVRKFSDDGTFMSMDALGPFVDAQSASWDTIESMVAPYGPALMDKFFENVHPVFPVLVESSFRSSCRTRQNVTPVLLASVYVLGSRFLDYELGPDKRPDVRRLEMTALKLLSESLPFPSMSTVQAGLILMQKSTLNTSALNTQLIAAGFELGLHQDCSNWKMADWEKGLRKRLAWALYMQDKWSSLVHGRPSYIFLSNWTVRDLVEQDFVDAFDTTAQQDEDDDVVAHGPLLFCHMVALTTILSDILDRFYTLQAIESFKAAGNNRTRLILEKAKPAQIRLKEWFSTIPAELKMGASASSELYDTTTRETARNGMLHLAYFAAEITLHRCIIRSLSPETTDSYLSHVCRSAAKTRLISAMDFVNRLRPMHLRSFWPSAARTNFALIGSFGMLLRITAPTREEAEFYRVRLCEYRWTLSVSKKDAAFMEFALESLDNATTLDEQHVPEKPGIEELMSNPKPNQHQHQQQHAYRFRGPTSLNETMLSTGTPHVISGLVSPATSISEEIHQDDTISAETE